MASSASIKINKEVNDPGISDTTCIGRLKVSSALKEKLKRSSRGFTSPVAKSSLNAVICDDTSLQSLKFTTTMKSISLEDIEGCTDLELLKQMHFYLQKTILDNEKKLSKLELSEFYNKKNTPSDFQKLILKWQTATQEAMHQLQEKLPENEAQNILKLLDQLTVNLDDIRYDPINNTFF